MTCFFYINISSITYHLTLCVSQFSNNAAYRLDVVSKKGVVKA